MGWYPQALFAAEQACRRYLLCCNDTPFSKVSVWVKSCQYLSVLYIWYIWYQVLSIRYYQVFTHLRTYLHTSTYVQCTYVPTVHTVRSVHTAHTVHTVHTVRCILYILYILYRTVPMPYRTKA